MATPRGPRSIRLIEVLSFLAVAVIAVTGLLVWFDVSPRSGSKVALEVADRWTVQGIDRTSRELGEAIAGDIPLGPEVLAAIIEDQVRDRVQWRFSEPVRKTGRRYEVVATAVAPIDIDLGLLPNKSYEVSADFVLDIDTESRTVVDSRFDVSSLSVRDTE